MELSASEIKEALHAPSLEGISLVHGDLNQDVGLADVLELLHANDQIDGCEEEVHDTWGFPIYRTAYGGATDRHWETLLQTIRQELPEELETQQRSEDHYRPGNPAAASKLLSLFRLEPFSDRDLLEKRKPRPSAPDI